MEGNRVELRDHGIWVKGSWMLSGAARTLEEDVALLAREEEPGNERALLLANANPATAVGEEGWAAQLARALEATPPGRYRRQGLHRGFGQNPVHQSLERQPSPGRRACAQLREPISHLTVAGSVCPSPGRSARARASEAAHEGAAQAS